jgi:hypothetical protein
MAERPRQRSSAVLEQQAPPAPVSQKSQQVDAQLLSFAGACDHSEWPPTRTLETPVLLSASRHADHLSHGTRRFRTSLHDLWACPTSGLTTSPSHMHCTSVPADALYPHAVITHAIELSYQIPITRSGIPPPPLIDSKKREHSRREG